MLTDDEFDDLMQTLFVIGELQTVVSNMKEGEEFKIVLTEDDL